MENQPHRERYNTTIRTCDHIHKATGKLDNQNNYQARALCANQIHLLKEHRRSTKKRTVMQRPNNIAESVAMILHCSATHDEKPVILLPTPNDDIN